MLALSVGIGFGLAHLLGIDRVEDLWRVAEKGGTLLLALVASPIAWFAWLIRDRNRLEELRHQTSIKAREHFNKLREWANGSQESLQINALFELSDYLDDSRAGSRLPEIIAEERSRYMQDAQRFFGAMLRNREAWDEGLRFANSASAETGGRVTDFLNETSSSIRSAIELLLISNAKRIRDLAGADLRGMKLPKADFSNVNAAGALFDSANLKGALLQNTVLSGGQFIEADLSGAKLNHARMDSAKLIKSKLTWAKLSGADLSGANLNSADLNRAQMNRADLRNANLNNSRLKMAKLNNSDLRCAELNKALLIGADLVGADLSHAELEGSRLHRANLSGAKLIGSELKGARMREAILHGADFESAVVNESIVSDHPEIDWAGNGAVIVVTDK